MQDIIVIRILRFKGSVAALNKKFYFWRPQADAKFLCMLSLGSTCLLLVRAYNLLLTHFFSFTIVELLFSKWENAYDQMHVMTALIFRNQGYLAFFSPPVFLPVQLLSSQKGQTLKSNKDLIFYDLIKLQFLFITKIIVEF